MTEPERGAAPKKENRGRPTAEELVDVYKILHKAGKPLTVPEIAALMPKTGYSSGAQNAYRKHKEETDPVWLEGKSAQWSAAAKRQAMVWWVKGLVKTGRELKYFKPTSRSGNQHAEPSYTPGQRVPNVLRTRWVEESKVVPWSLEGEVAITGGHGAGIEFKQWYESEFVGKTHKVADLRAKIEVAYRAICKDFQ